MRPPGGASPRAASRFGASANLLVPKSLFVGEASASQIWRRAIREAKVATTGEWRWRPVVPHPAISSTAAVSGGPCGAGAFEPFRLVRDCENEIPKRPHASPTAVALTPFRLTVFRSHAPER